MEPVDSNSTPHEHGPLGTPRFLVRDRHLLLGATVVAALLALVGYQLWSNSWSREEVWETMRHLRNAGLALETAREQRGQYPLASDWTELALLPDRPTAAHLPALISELPIEDGWGFALEYRSDGATYELRSLGRDGRASPESRFCGAMASVDDEMLFADFSFVTFPPGGVY